jgi:TrpR family trp operon transcriptional repressor
MNTNDPLVAENINELCGILSKIDNVETMKRFFRDMFTPAENADFAARWALVKELDGKMTQRNIAKQYGLSLCKITRGARQLKDPDSAFHVLLEMHKKGKK